MERAARRSGAELPLVQQSGDVVFDGTQGVPAKSQILKLLIGGDGETLTSWGERATFPRRWTRPSRCRCWHSHGSEVPFAGGSLVVSVAVLATLLVVRRRSWRSR